MKQQFTVFIILIVSAMTTFAAEHSYDAEFEPTPPEPFPADYKDYQILPFSFSPNQKMALIYVKRSLLYSLPGCSPLFLAALKPFRVLTEIPLDHSNLAANAHGYYAVNWAHDSSALVVIEGRKWGPDKVFLVPIRDGKAGLVADLTAEVKKEVYPDFEKSKANRYNEYVDFIFDSENRYTRTDHGEVRERGWDINQRGQVLIDCTCTTDPKELETPRWTVRFKGIWDTSKTKFIQKSSRGRLGSITRWSHCSSLSRDDFAH